MLRYARKNPLTGKTCALIASAGQGLRMQNTYPPQISGFGKIFLPLLGHPLISWTVKAFEDSFFINEIVLVLNKTDMQKGMALREKEGWKKVKHIVPGGSRRQDSVNAGLEVIGDCQWVVVHDGARPCITSGIIEEGLREAAATGCAIAAVPVKDTIKLADSSRRVKETIPRERLWAAQTPQIFRYDLIKNAYKINKEVTDDSSLAEMTGASVRIFMGSYDNIKITTPSDLKLAEAILRSRQR